MTVDSERPPDQAGHVEPAGPPGRSKPEQFTIAILRRVCGRIEHEPRSPAGFVKADESRPRFVRPRNQGETVWVLARPRTRVTGAQPSFSLAAPGEARRERNDPCKKQGTGSDCGNKSEAFDIRAYF
jgi:hypothetical protein